MKNSNISEKDKILLFPCIEKNIGDDLFIKLICERYPDTVFLISARADYGDLSTISNLEFSSELESFLVYTGRVPHNLIKRKLYASLGNHFRNKLGKHKAGIMIVGNAFKSFDYEGSSDSEWFSERKRLADKFYIISTNFGPYSDERWKEDFVKLFAQCEDVCFRDSKSFGLFPELQNIRYAPDAVFSLGRISNNADDTVIVSVIDCDMNGRPNWLRECRDSYENKLIEIIDLLTQQNYRIVLLNSNDMQDNNAAVRIQNRVNNDEMISIFHYDGNIDDVIQLYKTARAVISTRLHTMILGLLSGIPVFPVVYDEKVEGILKSVGFTEEYADIRKMCDVDPVEVVESFKNYGYYLPDSIIQLANTQFAAVDKYINN